MTDDKTRWRVSPTKPYVTRQEIGVKPMTDEEMASWRTVPLETWPVDLLIAEVEELRHAVANLAFYANAFAVLSDEKGYTGDAKVAREVIKQADALLHKD